MNILIVNKLKNIFRIIFTDNQWTPFDVRDKLKKKDFDEIFAYYDKVIINNISLIIRNWITFNITNINN